MAIEAGPAPQGLPRLGHSALPLVGAGTEAKLRAGAFVSLRVLGEGGPGLWRLDLGGRLLLARSELQLRPGELLRARVERGGEGLVLRLLASPAARQDALLAGLGLPPDAASRAALLALLAEGLKPEAARLLRLRRVGLTATGEEERRERAALGARLEAKGLGAEAGGVEALRALLAGRGPGGEDASREGKREGRNPGPPPIPPPSGQGEGSRGGEAATGSGPEARPAEGPPASELAELEALLSSLAGRRGEGGLLSLFNHLGKRGGVLLPFAFSYGNIAFEGSLLLQLPQFPGAPPRLEARFAAGRAEELSEDRRPWYLVLDRVGSGGWRLRFEAPRPLSEPELGRLRELLISSGCELSAEAPRSRDGGSEELDLDA